MHCREIVLAENWSWASTLPQKHYSTDGRRMCVWMMKDYHDNTNKQIRNIVNRNGAFVLFAIMNSGTNKDRSYNCNTQFD